MNKYEETTLCANGNKPNIKHPEMNTAQIWCDFSGRHIYKDLLEFALKCSHPVAGSINVQACQ